MDSPQSLGSASLSGWAAFLSECVGSRVGSSQLGIGEALRVENGGSDKHGLIMSLVCYCYFDQW